MKNKINSTFLFRWFSGKVFERAGFRWEVRRSGDLKLGIWRKKFPARARRKTPFKRFVMVPGFGDSPNSWQLVLSLISPVLRSTGYDEFVVVDFPGFNGRLAKDKCIPSMDLLVEAVGDLLDWLEPHTIFAHSLGGWLTGRYAADCGAGLRPKNRRRHGYEGPEHLILAAPAGIYESDEVRAGIEEVFRELTSGRGFSALRPHLFAREPVWFSWVAEGFARFAADAGIRMFTESVREDQLLDERLAHIRAKTWLIWGDRDTLVPTGGMGTWLGRLKTECSARAVTLKGIGHSPHLESPGVMAAVLGQILLGRVPHGRGQRWWRIHLPESATQSSVS